MRITLHVNTYQNSRGSSFWIFGGSLLGFWVGTDWIGRGGTDWTGRGLDEHDEGELIGQDEGGLIGQDEGWMNMTD